jgi:PAS domain S-box-containing protein
MMKKVSAINNHRKPKSQKKKRILKSDDKIRQDKKLDFHLLDGIPIGLYRSSTTGRILDANNTLVEMFGFPDKESFRKANATELYLNPADRKKWQALMDSLGVVQNFETQMKTCDGRSIWIEDDARAVRDNKGRILFYEGSLQDITNRKRAEVLLQDSEERYRSTFDNMMEGCQIIGFDWSYLYVNDSVVKHGHQRKENLLGRTMMEIYPGIEKTEMFGFLARCMSERVPHQMENEFNFPDGSTGWFELSIQPVPEGIFILSIDITERKQAEGRIKHLNLVLRSIRNVNQLIVQEKDRNALVRKACKMLTETRGYSHAWIALIGENKSLINWASSNMSLHFKQLKGMFNRGEMNECAKMAMRQSGVISIEDKGKHCTGCPLIGVLSLETEFTIRLEHNSKIYGFLAVSIPPVMVIHKEEQQLFEEIAGDLAYALHGITAEEDLKQTEALFRNAMEYAVIGNALVAPDGRWLKVNRSLCTMLGYSEDEFLKVDFQMVTHPDDLESDLEYVRQMLAGEIETYQMEKRYIHKQGHLVWALLSVSLVHNSPGEPLYFISQIQDISVRKQAELALQKSEQRLKEAEQSAKLGHWELDLKKNSLYWSDEVFRIFGLNPTSFKATYEAFLEVIHPDDREYVNKTYSDSLKNKKKYNIIHRLKLKDGAEKYVEETCKTEYDDQGAPLRSIGTVQEITDYVQTQKEIVRKTELLEAINSVFQETLTCESEEDFAYTCITVAEKITGSQVGFIGELNEKGLFDTITYGDLKWGICQMPESKAIRLSKDMQIRGIWAQTIITGKSQIVNEPASFPERVGTPEGHPQLTSFLGVPLTSSGKTIGMIGLANKKGGYVTTDVESVEALSFAFVEALMHKRAEQGLKKSLQEKDSMLSEIHHRVKNNMNVIVGLLNLQSRKIEDLPSIIALQSCVKRIHSMALVHEKLYQSKDFTNINIRDYIETLVHELAYSYGRSKEIKTNINVSEISIHIETAIPLGLIINELMTNATKYAFPEGRKGYIKISLIQLKENFYELIMQDNGIGIPKDINMETVETLGLKLVHLLTKQLNGKISINTEKGTTFRIQFKGKLQ